MPFVAPKDVSVFPVNVDCVVIVEFEIYPVGSTRRGVEEISCIPTATPFPVLACVSIPEPKLLGFVIVPLYNSEDSCVILPSPLKKFELFGLTEPFRVPGNNTDKVVVSKLPVPSKITSGPDSYKNKLNVDENEDGVGVGVGVAVGVGVGVAVGVGVGVDTSKQLGHQ